MSTTKHIAEAHTPGMKTLKAYVQGVCLSLFFTLVSFGIVAIHVNKLNYWPMLSDTGLYITLAILAIAQLLVQVICFLRLNNSKEGKWELMPFIFTILIVAILVSGTLWIMYNLNYNMMH